MTASSAADIAADPPPGVRTGHHFAPAEARLLARQNQRRLQLVAGLTALFLLLEAAAGWLTGSLALLADAGHMLADVLGLGMALAALHFAQRPATPARTYGFYRAEILAALANCLLLLGIGAYILFEAWQRLVEPRPVASLQVLLVALVGLSVNLVAIKLLHGGATHSLNLRAALLEVYSDLLGSVGVIVSALLGLLTGWQLADTLVSILIALLILPRTWQLLRTTLEVLLEATPGHVDTAEIEQAMLRTPGVTSVHELHVWSITSGFVALSAHVTATGRSSAEVLHDLQLLVRQRFGIEHSTLQVESADHADDGACCSLDPRCLLEPVAGAGLARLAQDER
jgi:cobalt-zinc-cadmium efflux system protein